MLGRVLNTHQQWLCRRLADLGYVVSRQMAVADSSGEIEQAVREALSRADLVITTGGLGPTSDDITRESIARLLGKSLREDVAALDHIRQFFASRNRPMPDRTRLEALVPEGATVLANLHGTAPGLAMELRPNGLRRGGAASWLVMLPGPPRELRPMFTDAVVPLLQRVMPLADTFICRTLRTTGVSESSVQEKIAGPLQALAVQGLEIGYCARPSAVDVRLAAQGAHAERIVGEAKAVVRKQLGPHIFGEGDIELEAVVVRLLTARKQIVAVAESCTGGCLAHRLTNIPGASEVFKAGLVTYSNAAKEKYLGVRAETLAEHGAVSKAVAREMAQGAMEQNQADFGIGITGIAGPDGGTQAKPVGTVFIGLATPVETVVQLHLNPWDRETFKQVTAQQALELLRSRLVRTGS